MNIDREILDRATTQSEIGEVLSAQEKIDGPLLLDSASYTPYKWSVFCIYMAIIGFSLWLLFSNYFLGDIPPSGILHRSLFAAFVGVFFTLPFATYYLLNLLSPVKLLIDEVGITLYGFRKKTTLNWTDIEAISVRNPYDGLYDKSVIFTTVRSKFGSLKWGPYFGIDPNLLKDFLIRQKKVFVFNENK